MKRTGIKYREVGNLIEVLEINNAANFTKIEEEFGLSVAQLYFGGFPHYLRVEHRIRICLENRRSVLSPNSSYSKIHFWRCIEFMKIAGQRLGDINKQVKETEIKSVLI